MILRWLSSHSVRRAVSMRRHVEKLRRAQDDLLSADAKKNLSEALAAFKIAEQTADNATLEKEMRKLEEIANKHLRPYPHPSARENIEVALVALVVAMAIRTFFLQPFKIPTGSMQPTLFGIIPGYGSGNQPDLKIPNPLMRFVGFWVYGHSYCHIVAPEDGELRDVQPPVRLLLFNLSQKYRFNDKWYKIWFPPENVFERVGYMHPKSGQIRSPQFNRGQDVVRIKVTAGDHLFVNRLTYNFRHPKRGEIIVFETRDVHHPDVPQDQFYIKRLVGLGSERLRLRQNAVATNVPTAMSGVPVGHLVVNGHDLSANTQHFENLYGFFDTLGERKFFNYVEDQYCGHALISKLGPGNEFQTRTNGYFVLGDNTMNSLDSRFFGDFSREYVIGKSSFVYWPISERFGWGYR